MCDRVFLISVSFVFLIISTFFPNPNKSISKGLMAVLEYSMIFFLSKSKCLLHWWSVIWLFFFYCCTAFKWAFFSNENSTVEQISKYENHKILTLASGDGTSCICFVCVFGFNSMFECVSSLVFFHSEERLIFRMVLCV